MSKGSKRPFFTRYLRNNSRSDLVVVLGLRGFHWYVWASRNAYLRVYHFQTNPRALNIIEQGMYRASF